MLPTDPTPSAIYTQLRAGLWSAVCEARKSPVFRQELAAEPLSPKDVRALLLDPILASDQEFLATLLQNSDYHPLRAAALARRFPPSEVAEKFLRPATAENTFYRIQVLRSYGAKLAPYLTPDDFASISTPEIIQTMGAEDLLGIALLASHVNPRPQIASHLNKAVYQGLVLATMKTLKALKQEGPWLTSQVLASRWTPFLHPLRKKKFRAERASAFDLALELYGVPWRSSDEPGAEPGDEPGNEPGTAAIPAEELARALKTFMPDALAPSLLRALSADYPSALALIGPDGIDEIVLQLISRLRATAPTKEQRKHGSFSVQAAQALLLSDLTDLRSNLGDEVVDQLLSRGAAHLTAFDPVLMADVLQARAIASGFNPLPDLPITESTVMGLIHSSESKARTAIALWMSQTRIIKRRPPRAVLATGRPREHAHFTRDLTRRSQRHKLPATNHQLAAQDGHRPDRLSPVS